MAHGPIDRPGRSNHLFEVWRDHGRGIERRVLIDRMPELLKQRDALVEQMPT